MAERPNGRGIRLKWGGNITHGTGQDFPWGIVADARYAEGARLTKLQSQGLLHGLAKIFEAKLPQLDGCCIFLLVRIAASYQNQEG